MISPRANATEDDLRMQAIPEIAARARIAPPRTIRRFQGGVANHVYCLDERYVLRLGTGPDGPQFPKSAAILRAVSPEMLAPRVLFTDFSHSRYPFNVMLLTYCPGVSLCDCWPGLSDSARHDILAQVPPQLEILHRVPRENIPTLCDAPPWRDALAAALDKGFRTAAPVAPAGWIPRLRDAARVCWPAVDAAAPDAIIHHDAHWNNLIVDPAGARLLSIIDFDDASLAPPEVDAWYLTYLMVYADHPHDPSPICHPEAMARAVAQTYSLWPSTFTSGWRERYILRQVLTVLDCLTDIPPWLTEEERRIEAEAIYGALFAPATWPKWLDGPR